MHSYALGQNKNLELSHFRRGADGKHLDLHISKGLTVLVGENDAGKAAIMDALRLILGTTSHDYLRINEEDFNKVAGKVATQFSIYCKFENLSKPEAGRFLSNGWPSGLQWPKVFRHGGTGGITA